VTRGGQRFPKPPHGAKSLTRKGDAGRFAVGLPLGDPPEVGGPLVPLLTCAQVGTLLGVRPRNVVEFIRTRGLRAVHLGRKLGWRIAPSDLTRWIEGQKRGRP